MFPCFCSQRIQADIHISSCVWASEILLMIHRKHTFFFKGSVHAKMNIWSLFTLKAFSEPKCCFVLFFLHIHSCNIIHYSRVGDNETNNHFCMNFVVSVFVILSISFLALSLLYFTHIHLGRAVYIIQTKWKKFLQLCIINNQMKSSRKTLTWNVPSLLYI